MIYFLIPSYNESENIPILLEKLRSVINVRHRIFIIDDGSIDKTKHLVKSLSKKYPVEIIGYKKNRGPGYAFKFGFNYLIPKLNDNDIVVTMEADNTSDLTIVWEMIDQSEKSDVVLASPHAKGGKFLGISATRNFLSLISNHLDQAIFRLKNVKTYSSFYRVYTAKTLKKAKETYGSQFITNYGFSSVIEILIKLSRVGAKFTEVPSVVDWRNRKGKSKMKLPGTIVRHLMLYQDYFQGKYN